MMDTLSENALSKLDSLDTLFHLLLKRAREHSENPVKQDPLSLNEQADSSSGSGCSTNMSVEDLEIVLGYLDKEIVTEAQLMLGDENTVILDKKLGTLNNPKKIALLYAWNRISGESCAPILDSLIEVYISEEISMKDDALLFLLIIIYGLESPRASDVVNLVINTLDAAAQQDIQHVIEQYHLTVHGNDIFDSSTSNDEKPKVPILNLHCLTSLKDGRRRLSEGRDTDSHYSQSHYGTSLFSPDPLEPTSDSRRADYWKKKFMDLNIAFDELEQTRDSLKATNNELEKRLHDKNDVGDNKKGRPCTQRDMTETVFSEVYRLEEKNQALRDELEKTAREKKTQEKYFTNEMQRLKDENQLCLADSHELIKLQTAMGKYKAYAEELGVMKIKNQELNKTVQDYLSQIVQLETQLKAAQELKVSVEMYKGKLNDLEDEKLKLTTHCEELQKKINTLEAALEESENNRHLAQRQLENMDVLYQNKISEDRLAHPASTTTSIGDEQKLHERVFRLEKENELLREQDTPTTAHRLLELEFQLDTVTRSKATVEKQLKLLLNKNKVDEQGSTQEQSDAELRSILTHTEGQLSLKEAQCQALETTNKSLEAQLESEKVKAKWGEEAIRKDLEAEYASTISALKDKLHLHEKQLNFMTLSRNEETLIHRRQERLMSVVFHHLGCLVLHLQTNYHRVMEENKAVHLRSQTGDPE